MGEGPVAEIRPMVAKAYHKTKHKVMDKYSYLYEKMTTLDDYRSFFCPEQILYGGGNYVVACNEEQRRAKH